MVRFFRYWNELVSNHSLEKANEAVINAFKHYWLLEQEIIAQGMYLDASRQTKLSVAICLSYFRY